MATAVEVVTGFMREFSRNDPDAIAAMVAENFHNQYLSSLGSDCVGRDEYRRRLPHFLEAFSDRQYEIEDIVAEHREAATDVVVKYRFIAVYRGAQIEMPGIVWFAVHNNEITRRVDSWDSLTFLRQTGEAGDLADS